VSELAAISLGSNLGDRRGHLEFAIDRLATLIHALRVSDFFEFEAVDVPTAQPPYLNAAAVGQTEMPPEDLLDALMAIERERGRERHSPKAPRTLDLDLILLGDRTIESHTLWLPHPRFRERRFVLAPLATLVPEAVDPVTGQTIAALLAHLDEPSHDRR
jgi:2-amino-4-hydroxy-6-hydroxymethyldihydropteridine diphosphokinase